MPWNKGKIGSQEAWNKGIKASEETRAKQSAIKKRRVSINGIIYESIAEASKAMGFDNYNRVTGRCNSILHPDWFFVDGEITRRKPKIGTPKGPMSEESRQKMIESKKQNKNMFIDKITIYPVD